MKLIDFIERAWPELHPGVPFKRSSAIELACEVAEMAALRPESVHDVLRYELQAVASAMRRSVGRHADQFIVDDPNGSEP